MNAVDLRTTTGVPVVAGSVRVTPEARALVVRLPFGALAWNRPSAVIVERDGHAERLRVVDVTRIIQVALWGSALVLWLVVQRRTVQRKEHAA